MTTEFAIGFAFPKVLRLAMKHATYERDAHRRLSFGKYKGETYEWVAYHHPEYCSWVKREPAGAQDEFRRFKRWLLLGSHVGFGKYRNLSYSDVIEKDPEYCGWILEQKRSPTAEAFGAFRSFLKSNLIDLYSEQAPDQLPYIQRKCVSDSRKIDTVLKQHEHDTHLPIKKRHQNSTGECPPLKRTHSM